MFRVHSDYYHKPAVWAVTNLTRTGATVKSDQTTILTDGWTWMDEYLKRKEKVLDQNRENQRVAEIFQRNAIRLQRYKEYVPIDTMVELERIKGGQTGDTNPGQEVGYTYT